MIKRNIPNPSIKRSRKYMIDYLENLTYYKPDLRNMNENKLRKLYIDEVNKAIKNEEFMKKFP